MLISLGSLVFECPAEVGTTICDFGCGQKSTNSSNLHVCDSACLDSRVLGAPPTRP